MGTTYRQEQILSDVLNALTQPGNLQDVCHLQWQGEPLPSQHAVSRIIQTCRALIFPGFFDEISINRENIASNTEALIQQLYTQLYEQVAAGLYLTSRSDKTSVPDKIKERAEHITIKFISRLPELRRMLNTDVHSTYNGDPAASSTEEVIYCYPGIQAITNHRIAHELALMGVPVIPRMIAEQAHSETGIDIHPNATIGESFTIDHGTGIVIGETAILGHNVKLYQGVTIGAKSFDTDANGNPVKGIPRHPIIGNNVIIYSNSSILGRITIGDGAIIGGNIWITDNVSPGEKLIQAKANNILRLKQQ
jgi:serine O-acetyltransferase